MIVMKKKVQMYVIVSLIQLMVIGSPSKFILRSGSHDIPFPAKKYKGGEDAHGHTFNLLAVADGVGGWNDQGIDPALYSRKLVHNVLALSNQNSALLDNPKELLIQSARANKEKGSSTLVIATLSSTALLRTSMIGDSGYIILRMINNSISTVYRSVEQQHSFNYPFQVGHIGDDPMSALEFEHQLEDNDLVILGSDGLFDNVFDDELIGQLKEVGYNNSERSIAESLASLAFKLSLDKKRSSPFAKQAVENGLWFEGGKSDDITVVVGRVFQESQIELQE